MNYEPTEFRCEEKYPDTKRKEPFIAIKYHFDYNDSQDKSILDEVILKSEQLANKVYAGAANNSTQYRSTKKILANCIGGMMAEFCWKHFLNYKQETVRTTPFLSASNQIDLETINGRKKIEIRSSFPRNGIKFAICHPQYEFKIVGPYSNSYKPSEPTKDYFLSCLFPLENPFEIIKLIRSSDFNFFLTGGATYQMMFDNNISYEKTLVPEGSIIPEVESSYRVVPFHNALDCRQIYHLITNIK